VSRINNVPPTSIAVVNLLRLLGVEIDHSGSSFVVHGKGLNSFKKVNEVISLTSFGDVGLMLLSLLSAHTVRYRVDLGLETQWFEQVLQCLSAMGMQADRETDSIYSVGAQTTEAVTHDVIDIAADVKMAILLASLYCSGKTTLRETEKNRNRVERFLRVRGVTVERRKFDSEYRLSLEGKQNIQPLDADIPGDLNLAYPFLLPALVLKGSQLVIRSIAVRSGQRYFLDFLRQIGADIELVDLKDNVYDLTARASTLKPTRIAGNRTEKILPQILLLVVLATRVTGETVIRDIESLRNKSFDIIEHVFDSMRALSVRIGEFHEGLVIKGGFPVSGGKVDSKRNAELIQAFAILSLWCEDEVFIENTETLEKINPHFFEILDAIKEKKS
jgi:3-phosphoshikimate 1-carboxyvinyltransferase